MAQVEGRQTTNGGTSSATLNVSLPSGVVAGELLEVETNVAATFRGVSHVTPPGWQTFAYHRNMLGFRRIAEGGETSVQVRFGGSGRRVAVARRISGDNPVAESEWPGPAGYFGMASAIETASSLHVADRQREVASETPGAFTYLGSAAWMAGTVAVHPSGASAPVIEDRELTPGTSAVTSHDIDLPPNIVSGELLIVAFGQFSTADHISWPAGWTVFAARTGSSQRVEWAYRVADGSEGATINITTTSGVRRSAVSFRVSGAEAPGTQAPEVSTGASGSGASVAPDELTPTGGSKNYLWLAYGYHASDSKLGASASGTGTAPDPPSYTASAEAGLWLAAAGMDGTADVATAAPTNYTNLQTIGNTIAAIGSAERVLTATTEDPGAFTFGTSSDWSAFTVAVVEGGGGATGQLLTVESVTHVGAWTDELDSSTAGDIASSIGGETANDATFAQSEESPSSSPLVFKFSNASAPSSSTDPHTVTVRIAKDAAGGDQIDLTLELREGYVSEASPGTLIASDTFLNLSDTIAESVLTLTQGEAESITDWTALYGRVVATVPA